MSIIDDDHELDRILESTNLLACQCNNLVTRRTSIRASQLSGLAPCEGTSTDLRSGVDPC